VVTLLQHCSYTVATRLLHGYDTVVTLLLHCGYTGATLFSTCGDSLPRHLKLRRGMEALRTRAKVMTERRVVRNTERIEEKCKCTHGPRVWGSRTSYLHLHNDSTCGLVTRPRVLGFGGYKVTVRIDRIFENENGAQNAPRPRN
jgi:hypothetical protein